MSSSTCPACHAPVAPGSTFCTRCGAVIDLTVVDAGVEEAQRHWGGSRRPTREHVHGADGGVAVASRPRQGADVRVPQPLGPAFDGVTPARVGRRVAATVLDLLIVALPGVAVLLLTGSVVVTALVVVEAAVALVLAEARTGATPGQLALGLRTARLATPFAPGLGRSVLRGALVGLSSVLPVIGPLVLVATAGLDGTGRRRAWHDLASGCVVVDVRALRLDPEPDVDVLPVPGMVQAPGTATSPPLERPAAPATPVRLGTLDGPVATVDGPPARTPAAQPVAPPVPVVEPPTTPGAVAEPVTHVDGPEAVPAPVGEPEAVPAGPALYVVTLDTGEAMSVSGPGVVGRRPVPIEGEPCDHAIAIDDPGRSLSRTHARFGVGPEGFWVEDLASANGTRVEAAGAVVDADPGQRLTVPDGATVHLGDRTFTVTRYA
ncbi:FHA domain-containing protein [Cellulomonas sp. APG4]|uniref:RDD family protein n=1 Tax=Cellulomonas sp. APG4 TaxID=1538656 RepID=UPI00137B238B|nr:RDD family protein [Cellulomonas sp. APG4]NCT89738.1 FHA domain-containing protein [Cellulomonas sp. APG4]